MKLNQNTVAFLFTLLIMLCIKGYFGLIDSKIQYATAPELTVIKQSEVVTASSNNFENDESKHDVKINEIASLNYRIVSPFPSTVFGIITQNNIVRLYNTISYSRFNHSSFDPGIPLYISYKVLLI